MFECGSRECAKGMSFDTMEYYYKHESKGRHGLRFERSEKRSFPKTKIVNISSLRIFVWSYRDSQSENVKKNKLTQKQTQLKCNPIWLESQSNKEQKSYTLIQRSNLGCFAVFNIY